MAHCILPKNNVGLTATSDILMICDPLFKRTGLTYFHYYRLYKDNRFFVLLTCPNWLEYFFEQGLAIEAPLPTSVIDKQAYISLWEGNISNQLIHDARNLFDINLPISFVERHKDYYDEYAFGMPSNYICAIDFYLNNMDLLRNFIEFFNEKAAELINRAEKSVITLPHTMQDPQIDQLISPFVSNQANVTQPSCSSLRAYSLQDNIKKAKLTHRELDCLEWVITGKSAKETAKLLNISHRTVENHIEKLKLKFMCRTKLELIAQFHTSS